MGITIREIAKKSGFSRGTVSRALADPPVLVKEETREKILEVARKYGYVKNINAQALGEGRSRDVGLIVPAMFVSPFYRDFYSKLVESVLFAANKRGYGIRLILVSNSNKFLDIMNKINSYRLSGLIMAPDWWGEFYKNRDQVKKLNMPVVLLNKPIKAKNISSVVLDDLHGGYEGTKYLIKLGHKKIAIYRGHPEDMELRYEGYKKAMKEHGLKIRKEFVLKGDPDEKVSGHINTEKVLGCKVKPTAIFCLGDEMAFEAIRTAENMGFKCPADISILGYDGLEIGQFTSPGLTTMRRPVEEMGRRAVKLLLGKKKKMIKHQMVRPQLVKRGSCKKK